jgi:putative integral membrane protein (TIGR02587 family)
VGRKSGAGWREERGDVLRAFSGAFLLGVPLLFTMEMWWLGIVVRTWQLLAFLAVALVANLALSYFAGFKHQQERSLGRHIDQAIDAVAVGAISSAAVLLALNRISLDDPLDSVLGKIIVQTALLSMGASVANAIFARGAGRQGDEQQSGGQSFWRVAAGDVGATAVGGLFIGVSIAPTDEIRMLAAQLTSAHLVALIALSLVITYIIVFESGFDRSVRRQAAGLSRMPIAETMMAYVVALLVALGSLFLFNQADLSDPIDYVLAQTLVLGVPTAIGGAAGRLVL